MKSLFLVISAFTICSSVWGQSISNSVISSSGAYLIAANGSSLSETVAEMTMTATFKSTISGNDYYLTQGFQQTYTAENTGINAVTDLNAAAIISPNPSTGDVVVRLNYSQGGTIQINAFDILGRSTPVLNNYVYTGANTTETTALHLANLAAGVYFIQVAFTPNGATKPEIAAYKLTIVKS